MFRRKREAALGVSQSAGFIGTEPRVSWVDDRGNHFSGTEADCRDHMAKRQADLDERAAAASKLEAEAGALDLRLTQLGAPPLEKGHHYITILSYDGTQWLPSVRVDDGKVRYFNSDTKWFDASSQSTASIIFAAWEAWEHAYPKQSLPDDARELIFGN